MPEENESFRTIIKRLSWLDKLFWIVLLSGATYILLKIVSNIIKHRDTPITVGMAAVVFLGALWCFITAKLDIKIKNKIDDKTGCRGCWIGLLWVVGQFLIPIILWHLAFWLMGLLGLISHSEVENFTLFVL
jgi:hypothetical protein